MQAACAALAPAEVVQVVDEAPVLQQCALWPASRPAGEDDVGQAVGRDMHRRPAAGVLGNVWPIIVHLHTAGI